MSDEMPRAMASKKIGDLLVIWVTSSLRAYIAEVIGESPLILKVKEGGPYSRLKYDDFVILEKDSLKIQGNDSGLKRLGVEDGKLHEILPVE
ncbi:MAG: hypothetical protein UT43_C0028G0012 [Parcubacteria group bacterium GW2011_GWC1_39_29]|nr:MAG: hypothetical protein UT43_C0028G0012 [Parcubacteria group bacterium GW2011_GWC1_39_29]